MKFEWSMYTIHGLSLNASMEYLGTSTGCHPSPKYFAVVRGWSTQLTSQIYDVILCQAKTVCGRCCVALMAHF
jgi:hypothetical protein